MTKPTSRELRAVSNIEVLGDQEVVTLLNILKVLGFDTETIAFLWEDKPVGVVKEAFSCHENKARKLGSSQLTGTDLAFFCDLIQLRPGVVQRKLNFDESKPKTKKVGHKNTAVKLPWVGPPDFCLTGSCAEGRVFREIYRMSGVSNHLARSSRFDSATLSQIYNGKYPVRLQQLRDLLAAAKVASAEHRKLSLLKKILVDFPLDIRSEHEVLEDVLSPKTETNLVRDLTTDKKDETMKMEKTNAFRDEFARRNLGPVLVKLIGKSSRVALFLSNLGVDVSVDGLALLKEGDCLHFGEFGELMSSEAFSQSEVHQDCHRPLLRMNHWWKKKQEEILKIETAVQNLPKPKYVDAPNRYSEEPGMLPNDRSFGSFAVETLKPTEVVKIKKSKLDQTEVDGFGLLWNFTNGTVTVRGKVVLQINKVTGYQSTGLDKTVVERIYATLLDLRDQGNFDWQNFLGPLSLDRLLLSDFGVGSGEVKPAGIALIISSLLREYEIELTVEQLLRLKPLSGAEVKVVRETATGLRTHSFSESSETSVNTKARFLIADHGERILLLCDVMGRRVKPDLRFILTGDTKRKSLSTKAIENLSSKIGLPKGVLLGKQNFDREFSFVTDGCEWKGPPQFFVSGEARLGGRFARVIDCYRRERKYFRQQHAIDPEKLEEIRLGRANVPVPVFYELVNRVQSRLSENENNTPPRAFKALVELGHSVPAKLMKG